MTASIGIIYTVGHSNHPLDSFIDLLMEHSIACVADVRSSPHSRFASQFNRESLERELKRQQFNYRWVGDLLGGRLVTPRLMEDGHTFYQRLTADPRYSRGLVELEALAVSQSVAVMCSEGDPLRCHRAIVIGRSLAAHGWQVRHILPSGRIMDQAALRQQLVRRYPGVQPNLFDQAPELPADPYVMQENEIAPRWQASSSADEEDTW